MNIGEVKGSLFFMEGTVYFLQSLKNGAYYIGSTENLGRRIEEHGNGKNKSTKYLVPWKLVFFKKYPTISEARNIEYRIKKLKSRKIIERIIQDQDIFLGR